MSYTAKMIHTMPGAFLFLDSQSGPVQELGSDPFSVISSVSKWTEQ
ncbi:hypothetical protein SAMN04515659_0846 [Dyella sp. 333MFSha]|nr:hypothetical protein SAMN04515659_0846 [Dyella sp. 333MFSha]